MNTTFEAAKAAGAENFAVETTGEMYTYALGVLPPIYGDKMFAMGERNSTASDGAPSYWWFALRGGRYWMTLGSQAQAETRMKGL